MLKVVVMGSVDLRSLLLPLPLSVVRNLGLVRFDRPGRRRRPARRAASRESGAPTEPATGERREETATPVSDDETADEE